MARSTLPRRDHMNRGETATANPGPTTPRAAVAVTTERPYGSPPGIREGRRGSEYPEQTRSEAAARGTDVRLSRGNP